MANLNVYSLLSNFRLLLLALTLHMHILPFNYKEIEFVVQNFPSILVLILVF